MSRAVESVVDGSPRTLGACKSKRQKRGRLSTGSSYSGKDLHMTGRCWPRCRPCPLHTSLRCPPIEQSKCQRSSSFLGDTQVSTHRLQNTLCMYRLSGINGATRCNSVPGVRDCIAGLLCCIIGCWSSVFLRIAGQILCLNSGTWSASIYQTVCYVQVWSYLLSGSTCCRPSCICDR